MRNILTTRVLRKRKCITALPACASSSCKDKNHETLCPFLSRHKPRHQEYATRAQTMAIRLKVPCRSLPKLWTRMPVFGVIGSEVEVGSLPPGKGAASMTLKAPAHESVAVCDR